MVIDRAARRPGGEHASAREGGRGRGHVHPAPSPLTIYNTREPTARRQHDDLRSADHWHQGLSDLGCFFRVPVPVTKPAVAEISYSRTALTPLIVSSLSS